MFTNLLMEMTKNFSKERPPHVLYLWHITQTYGILNNVQQQLKAVSCLDGNNAPSVSSSQKRKDLSSQSSESGYAVGQDIRSMTNSIDGLVRVAQESIKKQGIDSLHRQREVLESTIKECDKTILDIELKIVDADKHHVAIYEKALSKKQMEPQEKKEELDEIRSAIIKENRNIGRQLLKYCSKFQIMTNHHSHPLLSQHNIPLPLGGTLKERHSWNELDMQ